MFFPLNIQSVIIRFQSHSCHLQTAVAQCQPVIFLEQESEKLKTTDNGLCKKAFVLLKCSATPMRAYCVKAIFREYQSFEVYYLSFGHGICLQALFNFSIKFVKKLYDILMTKNMSFSPITSLRIFFICTRTLQFDALVLILILHVCQFHTAFLRLQ